MTAREEARVLSLGGRGQDGDLALLFSLTDEGAPSLSLAWDPANVVGRMSDAYLTRVAAATVAAAPDDLARALDGRPRAEPRLRMVAMSAFESVSQPEFLQRNPFGVRPLWARAVTQLVADITGVRPATEEVARARLAQVVLLAQRHATDPRLTPDTLATALGVSRRTLYLLTQGTLGGVSTIIREQRLDRAVDLLLERRDLGLQQVAVLAGFGTLPQLNRAAVDAFGLSASGIRTRGARVRGIRPSDPILLVRTGDG
jgi:AraC-like DNA-binding protein